MRKAVFGVLVALAVLLAATPSVKAHGKKGGGHTHVFIRAGWPIWGYPYWHPYWYPWGYYPPPYYAYPRVVVREDPPVYIQRESSVAPQAAPESYWYYCMSSGGYYPTVKECAEPWVKVPPQP
jgi:hypothetical protein